MHPLRQDRLLQELKTATALNLSVEIEMKVGDDLISNTFVLHKMPTLLFQAEGDFIVKCLPLNMIGVGKTKEEAWEVFGIDMAEILKESLEGSPIPKAIQELLSGPAADLYWSTYTRLVEQGEALKEVKRHIKDIVLTTDTEPDPTFSGKYREIHTTAEPVYG